VPLRLVERALGEEPGQRRQPSVRGDSSRAAASIDDEHRVGREARGVGEEPVDRVENRGAGGAKACDLLTLRARARAGAQGRARVGGRVAFRARG